MQRKYLSSVRVFFPSIDSSDIIKVREVAYAFSKELGLENVMLFGSYAEKKYTVASDIDLFVVFDERRSAKDIVYKTLMKNISLPRVELHIVSKRDYEYVKNSKWIKEIESKGIKIFTRKPND